MSDIPKSKRTKSNLEAHHQAIRIRKMLSMELLNSFAYCPKRLEAEIQRQTASINDPDQRAAAADAMRKTRGEYAVWFIKRHRDRVDDLACEICQHLRAANTIWPSYKVEFYDRRNELNQALKCCNKLQDELQYIAETLPSDKNRFMNIVLDIQSLFNVIKALRQSDNRFLKNLKD